MRRGWFGDFLICLFISIYTMDIAQRDKLVCLLRTEIARKRRQMAESYSELDAVTSTNQVLSHVLNDYQKHYAYIREQKEQERAFLRQLLAYLKAMTDQQELTNASLQHSVSEQHHILRELEHVNQELNTIIDSGAKYGEKPPKMGDKEDTPNVDNPENVLEI